MTNSARSCAGSQNGNFGEFCPPAYPPPECLGFERLSTTRATLIAIFCTLSSIFDVPVYWPILVMYFFVLFFLTMRRQIQLVPRQSMLLVLSSLTYSLQAHGQVQIRSLRHRQEDTLRVIGDTTLSPYFGYALLFT